MTAFFLLIFIFLLFSKCFFNEMYCTYYEGLKIRSKSLTNKQKLLSWVSEVTTQRLLWYSIYKSLNS